VASTLRLHSARHTPCFSYVVEKTILNRFFFSSLQKTSKIGKLNVAAKGATQSVAAPTALTTVGKALKNELVHFSVLFPLRWLLPVLLCLLKVFLPTFFSKKKICRLSINKKLEGMCFFLSYLCQFKVSLPTFFTKKVGILQIVSFVYHILISNSPINWNLIGIRNRYYVQTNLNVS
ncbi:MAG: hypothetical protein IJF69_05905, partial [Clostridia bacterium]|nr:hypothetical protein [Clostridia bacterium]